MRIKPTINNIRRILYMGKDSQDTKERFDCDDCFEAIDRFVDIQLAGEDPEEQMPLMKEHLEWCWVCRHEYEALLEALGVPEHIQS